MILTMTKSILCLSVWILYCFCLGAAERHEVSVLRRLEVIDERLAKYDEIEAKLAKLDAFEEKLTRFEEMEAKLKRLDEIEAKLVRFDEMEAKLKRVDELEAKLARVGEINSAMFKALKTKIGLCKTQLSGYIRKEKAMDNEAAIFQHKLLSLTKRVEKCENVFGRKENKEKPKIVTLRQDDTTEHKAGHKRALYYEGDPIAFTTYLDHDLNNIGVTENLVFNHVLLNDGNGYNMHTGVFTVPMSGVYHFDFFIGERNVEQVLVSLTVNSTHMLDAIVETVHTAQDLQGGNSANLKLVKGDAVYLKHHNVGSHIEGSDAIRISSFSGFLLYATDSNAIVG